MGEAREKRELFERLSALEGELRSLKRALGEDARREPFAFGQSLSVLCFEVDGDRYGAPLSAVREVIRYVELTRVSDVPSCVCGMVNVRGEVLPVLDARTRFGADERAPRLGTAIVILEAGTRTAGLVVDRVLDVTLIPAEGLAPPQGALAGLAACAAVATVEGRIVQILDVGGLLASSEWEDVAMALEASMAPGAMSEDAP